MVMVPNLEVVYKTVVCDRLLTLYRPCAYPGAVLRHASGPTGPRNSSRSFSSFIKSSLPGSSKSRCSRKQTKPSLSKINNSTLKMKLFLLGRASASPTVTCWLGLSSLAIYIYIYYRKRGSASYIVREVLSVRERERDTDRQRERERRKWRHDCRAKIGDEFTLSLAKNSRSWRWAYTFPCQKFALFVSPFTLPVSPFTERSPLWRWYSQRVHTFHCQKIFRPLCSPSFKWHEPRDEWSKPKTNDQILPSPILFFPSKNWIKLIPKTIGNRKRDCAWGGSGW